MNISFRLALFYGLFFVAGGVMLPFWPVWLEAKGLDKNQIGLALAIPAWMRVVGSLFWLRLAPHYSSYRYLLMTLLVFSLISYVLFSLVDSVTFILIIAAAAAFFYTPILPFTDHLTVRVSQMYKLDYGRIRLWGSIFFMMASMGSGMILKGQNPDWVLYTILMALALPIISIKLIP
ncbi:MAG TPA: MFS transporter, partial [Alphaproteobacteria bacterium]|nr:MFS transporter [Alphaproteobacteria bacterium]